MLALMLLFATSTTELDLTSRWITDADLARIGRVRELRKLDLSHTRITDAGIELLKDLPAVRELSLYYAEYVNGDGLAHLRGWKQLEVLNLRGTRVTSKVFEHLARLTALRSLDIAFTEIDDEGFQHLASLARLERLAIGGNRLSGSCLAMLKLMPALRDLDLGGIQRVDSGLWGLPLTAPNLARIGELRQLRRLSLASATLNDRGVDRPGHPEAERTVLPDLSALGGLADLEFLDLTRQPVTPEALRSLAPLSRLRELRLGLIRNIDESALPPLPALTRVYLNGAWHSLR
jgi:Leucine-rich repeat (LRR) protein